MRVLRIHRGRKLSKKEKGGRAKRKSTGSIEIEFRFDLFPGSAGLACVALHGGTKFHEVFHVFKAFLETAHFNGQGFQRWFFKGGITHRLLFGL